MEDDMKIIGIDQPVIQATWMRHDLSCLWGEVQYEGVKALTDKILQSNHN